MKNYKLLSVFATLTLMGCASTEKMGPIPEEARASIEKLNSQIQSKKAVGHHLLSPTEYQKSRDAYTDAMEAATSGESLATVNGFVTQGMMNLENLEANVELAKVHLDDVLEAREEAFNEGAYKLDSFKVADEELAELSEDIEERDLNGVLENEGDVRKMFVQSEIEAIQLRELKIARTNLESARDMDGADSFEEEIDMLEKNIFTTDDLISKYKDSSEQYMPSVKKVIDESKKVLALSSTATWVEDSSTRKLTMSISDDLNTIATPIAGAGTIQYLDYPGKVALLKEEATYVPYLKSELTDTQIAALNKKYDFNIQRDMNTVAGAEFTNSPEFKKAFTSIREKFSTDEAEVLVQGDKMIIRLVGMEFPIGKATIPAGSKSILDKVADSIKSFDSSGLEIQGHTDSTGNSSFNNVLSEKRAMAVNSYLTNSGGLTSVDAEVIGFGSKKPIAVNASANGRAMNRRVDIVIEPAGVLSE